MDAVTYNASLENLNAEVARTAKILKGLCPDSERSAFGLTPDHIKFSQEYRDAKKNFDFAFQSLRALSKGVSNKVKREAANLRRPKMYCA